MNPKLKPPGTERMKLKCYQLLSTSAFKLNLCHYTEAADASTLSDHLSQAGTANNPLKIPFNTFANPRFLSKMPPPA